MTDYKALTVINLPVIDVRKEPGDVITAKEWEDAGQTDEAAQALIKEGALSEDMDAPLHPDNQPPAPPPGGSMGLADMVQNAQALVDSMGKDAPKELKAFAKLDVKSVSANDTGKGVGEDAS